MRSVVTRAITFFVIATIALVSMGGVAQARPIVVGRCGITVNDPHPSGHVKGTINVQSTIECSLKMPRVHIQTWLFRSDGRYWTGKADSEVGVRADKKLKSNAAANCKYSPATFRNRTYISFTAPSFVTTPKHHSSIRYSSWEKVACGPRHGIQAPESEEITIEFLQDGTYRITDDQGKVKPT